MRSLLPQPLGGHTDALLSCRHQNQVEVAPHIKALLYACSGCPVWQEGGRYLPFCSISCVALYTLWVWVEKNSNPSLIGLTSSHSAYCVLPCWYLIA